MALFTFICLENFASRIFIKDMKNRCSQIITYYIHCVWIASPLCWCHRTICSTTKVCDFRAFFLTFLTLFAQPRNEKSTYTAFTTLIDCCYFIMCNVSCWITGNAPVRHYPMFVIFDFRCHFHSFRFVTIIFALFVYDFCAKHKFAAIWMELIIIINKNCRVTSEMTFQDQTFSCHWNDSENKKIMQKIKCDEH